MIRLTSSAFEIVSKRLKKLGELPLVRNFSWLMVSELFSRLSRFVTLFALAACFTNTQYGVAMLALLVHELFRVFTRLGTGAKIIQCPDDSLLHTLQNAASLQWVVALSVASLQIVSAPLLSDFYDTPQLEELICLMALAHLLYPVVTVRIFEQQRRNHFRYYGIASGVCIAFENILIAALVAFQASVMMVAIAKVAAAIFWVCLFYRLPSEVVSYKWQWKHQIDLLRFSLATLVSELNRMLRFQSDSLIAARLLPPEQFGLYSFAKSAGLGIAQSFSQAYLSTLYPYLCEQVRRENRVWQTNRTTRKLTFAICALFILQAFLANFYVEWLFDERWKEASSITALLCLVAIPTLVIDHRALTLRALDRAYQEMWLTALCTGVLFGTLILAMPGTVLLTSLYLLGCSCICCCLLTLHRFSLRPMYDKKLTTQLEPKAL